MKRVLIVDYELLFLSSLAEGLRPYAADGREAAKLLEQVDFDLLVTDLRMPGMDGFALIAHAARVFPGLPIVVVTAFGSAETERRLAGLTCGYIEKPIEFAHLVQTIRRVLAEATTGSFRGITLPGFLQLIEVERKTCSVWVEARGKVGVLHCAAGQLVGAEAGELRGEEAAWEVLAWEDVQIEVSRLQQGVKGTPIPLTAVLLEAARRKDEGRRGPALPLEGLLGLEGVRSAALLDPSGGQVLAATGSSSQTLAGLAPVAALAWQMAAGLAGEEVEEIALWGPGLALLFRPLRTPPGLLGLLLEGPGPLALVRLQLEAMLRRWPPRG
ncbi:DUF4388 domain-containing protein [Meiothermus sp. Pnk-1]|uniref:response regulator n=1 Tax=Meiothermus sp. Pnk-1 TaxID=873128 RepID=UPI000D7C3447|nr:DUF4388 domain-containing protein [Meiothermus sp. Pnk-1]PZA07734.1 response regulator [Meiothermus sp. Pnk-1]